jgi:hypothetical protein
MNGVHGEGIERDNGVSVSRLTSEGENSPDLQETTESASLSARHLEHKRRQNNKERNSTGIQVGIDNICRERDREKEI